MTIIVPKERRILCADDETYSLPINILDEHLSLADEELLMAMTEERPRTRFREGDFVMLTRVPPYLASKREIVPRCWKIRFIVTRFAYELWATFLHYGGALSPTQCEQLVENSPQFAPEHRWLPLIYAHGYPHGEYPDSTAWLPHTLLRRTIFNEHTMEWTSIIEEAGADYKGYDTNEINGHISLDLSPDNYRSGSNIGKPFRIEEPLMNVLCLHQGMEEQLRVPYITGHQDRVKPMDRDHDIFDAFYVFEKENR